jgi:NAD(P)-dependent dehydrogenase (short-subunit alcohol dehydrogenase family)
MSPSKTVLVTGAAKRLGRDIALALAAAGWQVAVHYKSSAQEAVATAAECAAFTPGAAHFAADLADEAAVRSLFARALAHFGAVDAVVNSASLFEFDEPASFAYGQLNRHMQTNAGAPILLASALFDHLSQRNATGCVVNLLDQKLWNVNPDFLSYSLSKAALHFATQMLAQKFAPRVRVGAVAPGLTYPSHLQTPADFERTAQYSLQGQISRPQDVAQAVRFWLENASMTGSVILVDAGQHLTPMGRDVSFL